MAIRTFIDSAGTAWRVWNSTPSVNAVMTARGVQGWLTFDSGRGRRRLTPVPAGWTSASLTKLEQMCRVAVPVDSRLLLNADDS